MIEAKIIADSISDGDVRLTTLQLVYPRFIHSEFMTHRMFSRNASSSRAIPVKKMLAEVWKNPAMPIHWGQNQGGMQARKELGGIKKSIAKALWKTAAKGSCVMAWSLMKLGVHKQITNRVLEPFQHIHVIVTATDWDNFFLLRDHPDAQPEIHELAIKIKEAMDNSTPKLLRKNEWHLPYVSEHEYLAFKYTDQWETALKLSAARCARVSYLKHDGTAPTISDDLELYNQLVTRPYTDKRGNKFTDEDPIHASPVEHQACPSFESDKYFGNFRGWIQNRKRLENRSLNKLLNDI